MLLLITFCRPLFGIFCDDAAVVDIGVYMLTTMMPSYILFVFIEIFTGALRGLSDVVIPTVITMTGRVPQGLAVENVMELLRKAAAKGARIVVDSRSFTLEHLKALGPWLIKPNQEEISAYLGREISSLEQTLAEARALHAAGIANVMISMGGDGALLVCKEGAFIAQPPVVEVKSTIGAGDSSIAGFISAKADDPKTCLLHAVAYGTAACMTEGTLPPRAGDVADLLPRIQCKVLA